MNLNQVTVPSLNVKKAISFYKSIGLKLIVESLSNYARFELPEGDATFSVHLVEAINESSGIIVYFENDQLDTLVQSLIEKGVVFDSMPEDKRWLWREAHLRDPDGNRIVLYTAGVNRKGPPWRLS